MDSIEFVRDFNLHPRTVQEERNKNIVRRTATDRSTFTHRHTLAHAPSMKAKATAKEEKS